MKEGKNVLQKQYAMLNYIMLVKLLWLINIYILST